MFMYLIKELSSFQVQGVCDDRCCFLDERPPIQFCTDSHILCFVPYLSCIFIPVTY